MRFAPVLVPVPLSSNQKPEKAAGFLRSVAERLSNRTEWLSAIIWPSPPRTPGVSPRLPLSWNQDPGPKQPQPETGATKRLARFVCSKSCDVAPHVRIHTFPVRIRCASP